MIKYLVKHIQPDIANVVWKLSKDWDVTSPATWKQFPQVLKYMVDTNNIALKFEPDKITQNKNWRIVTFSYSDFAVDNERRTSITGFILHLLGLPISWRSRGQKYVKFSSI